MKRIISLIAVAFIFTGCATEGKFVGANTDNDCDGKGKVRIVIKYGDSHLSATNRGNVKRKGEVIFVLDPDKRSDYGVDYSQLTVTIEGKVKPKDEWLDATGKGDDKKKTNVCVDENQSVGDYEYFVTVPSVGKLDPRIRVLPN